MMDENELDTCMEMDKVWRCPLQKCGKGLSRKQTLKRHLYSIHGLTVGNPRKCYKQYEYDESVPVPYTTARKRVEQAGKEHEDFQNSVGMPDADTLPDADTYINEIEMDESQTLFQDLTEVFEEEAETIESSSEDECEQTGNSYENGCKHMDNVNEEPPIYVLPPSSNIYKSEMTKAEHTLCVSAFSTRHKLSDAAIKDLLRLVQLHIPQNNIAETNISDLKEHCGFNKSYISCKLYCDSCKKVYMDDLDQCQTPGCDGRKSDSKSCKYFVTSDLKLQITEILERREIWESIEISKANPESDIISDITSSHAYKKLKQTGFFLHNSPNITLTMFTDGIPLFKSSSVSLWPVYFLINEIPAKERFLKKNMLLWGLWQGHGKPKMNMFLHPLVVDLLDLYNNGVKITTGSQPISVKVMLVVITMDLQARAFVTNMTQHNGEYGCLYCEEPGKVVESGKGRCRSYPQRCVKAPARTEIELQTNATEAQETGVRIKGVFGKSILSYLPYISIINSVVIDYMHGTLLGITKKFLHLWFDTKFKTQPFYIGPKMALIDTLLKKIQPPYNIHRMPRILTSTFIHWKASELRNWLLFYSLPCLQDYLPTLYFRHFSCLVEATYILLGQGISSADLERAEQLYTFFVTQAANLYGENVLSLNMHNLTHMVDCVKQWGPLWAWSCFSYESFNGEIKQSVHGTGNVCRQIFWAFQAQKRIVSTMQNSVCDGKVRDYLEDMLDSTGKNVGQDAYRCKVIKPVVLCSRLEQEVHEQLLNLVQFDNESDLLGVRKIVRNGCYMYSSTCTRTKKKNSYTIAFEKPMSSGEIAIEVQQYLLHKSTGYVFSVGKLISSKGEIVEGRVPHLQKLEISNEISVVKAENLREPLIIIRNNEHVFGALFPNHFERD